MPKFSAFVIDINKKENKEVGQFSELGGLKI